MIKTIFSGSLCALGLIAMTSTHAELSYEQELQQGCAKLKQYANNGKKLYDQKQYKKAIKRWTTIYYLD